MFIDIGGVYSRDMNPSCKYCDEELSGHSDVWSCVVCNVLFRMSDFRVRDLHYTLALEECTEYDRKLAGTLYIVVKFEMERSR